MMCHVVKVFITLQSLVASEDFADKSGFRYNIIPLHPRSSQQPIMLLQEVWTYFYSKLKNIPSGCTICPRMIKVHYKKNQKRSVPSNRANDSLYLHVWYDTKGTRSLLPGLVLSYQMVFAKTMTNPHCRINLLGYKT